MTQLRRDAARNRAKLTAAGREVFSEQGPDASLEEVARRAAVGIGTLYRHFPSREALVEEIFAEHVDEVVVAAETAAAAADAWAGLAGFLEHVVDLQARNLPLRGLFLRVGVGRAPERRRLIMSQLGRVIERGKEQGVVR